MFYCYIQFYCFFLFFYIYILFYFITLLYVFISFSTPSPVAECAIANSMCITSYLCMYVNVAINSDSDSDSELVSHRYFLTSYSRYSTVFSEAQAEPVPGGAEGRDPAGDGAGVGGAHDNAENGKDRRRNVFCYRDIDV